MPVPFFWICMGITSVAIGAIVAYEAHVRFTQFQEEQQYKQYARQYAQDHPPPPPPPSPPQEHQEHQHKENESGDEEENDEVIKHFVRDINDNNELRRRRPRSGSPPSTTNNDLRANNRPVSDPSYVDDTDYELNELERRLTDKKQFIERQQELLDKAEMDLERRWQIHQNRSSELLRQMSTSSFSSDHLQQDNINGVLISSSSSSSIQKQADCESFKETNPPSYASSTNNHVTPMISSTTSRILNNSSLDDESPERITPTNNDSTQERLSSSAISVPPSSIQSRFISADSSANLLTTPSSSSQEQQHKQNLDSLNGMNAENPWSFEDDDDGDDEIALSLSFRTSMRLPRTDDHPSSSSESQANDVISISSRATNSTLADHDINSLLSPSAPSSSSSVGGSYESVHSSDFENGS